MTIETLKELIDVEYNRIYSVDNSTEALRNEVYRLLKLYERDQVPDYRRPYIDPSTYFPTAGKEIPCGIPDKVPYGTLCPCNPVNGGSGVCGCIMGNQMVDNPVKYGQPKTNFTTGTYTAKDYPPGTTITNTPGVTGTITTTTN